jgi:type I restriction enzyme M protein
MRPESGQIIYDTACGIGGVLLGSYNYITNNHHPDREQKKSLKFNVFKGKDIVDAVARLCLMNMYLHGIGGEDSPLTVGYPLIADTGERFDMVMTNPNFGKESSITVFGGDGNCKAGKEAIIN